MARKKQFDVQEGFTKLRLTENAYVKGDFSPVGTTHEFEEAEADRRLKTQQFWELA